MLISSPLRMTIGSTLWLRHLVLLWRNTGLEIRLHYHRDSSKLFSLKVRNNVFLNRAQWCYRRKENPLFVNTKTTRTSPGDLFPLELIHCWNFVLVPPCMISWISIHDRRAEFYLPYCSSCFKFISNATFQWVVRDPQRILCDVNLRDQVGFGDTDPAGSAVISLFDEEAPETMDTDPCSI